MTQLTIQKRQSANSLRSKAAGLHRNNGARRTRMALLVFTVLSMIPGVPVLARISSKFCCLHTARAKQSEDRSLAQIDPRSETQILLAASGPIWNFNPRAR